MTKKYVQKGDENSQLFAPITVYYNNMLCHTIFIKINDNGL